METFRVCPSSWKTRHHLFLLFLALLLQNSCLALVSHCEAGQYSNGFEPLGFGLSTWSTCVCFVNGYVKCFGYNWYGQLGYGDQENRADEEGEMGANLPRVDLGTGRRAYALTGGYGTHCALLDGGEVKCWGNNQMGELGLGDVMNRGESEGQMGDNLPTVDLGTGRSVVQIEGGDHHTCAVLDNGDVKCWGSNTKGQLGLGVIQARGDNPDEMGDKLPKVDLGTGRTALWIELGLEHSCAKLDNGDLKCWGYNAALGLGDIEDRGVRDGQMGDNLPAVDLGTGRTAINLAGGRGHTCAVLDNNQVKCWGWNRNGVLGYGDLIDRGSGEGDMGDSLGVVDLGSNKHAVEVHCQKDDVCALLNDTGVKCWGSNGNGQLGLEFRQAMGASDSQMGDFLPELNLGPGAHVSFFAVGYDSNCVELSNQSIKCWGRNNKGQLGYGDRTERGSSEETMGTFLPAIELIGEAERAGCFPCGANATSAASSISYEECKCNVGFSGPDGGLCTECIPGRFKAESGSASCDACAAGSYQSESAASTCSECPQNTGSARASAAISECFCLVGYSGPGGNECSACSEGTFKAANGSAKCDRCPAGTYTGAAASSNCTACPAFTTSKAGSRGVDACVCAPGYTGESGNCAVCTVGTFKGVNGSDPCSPCPRGTYQDTAAQTVCRQCPENSVSGWASEGIEACICDAGYSGQDGVCTACPRAMFKDHNGSDPCSLCPANTYSSVVAATSCADCPTNTVSRTGAAVVESCICDLGYTGPDGGECAACELGEFKEANGSAPCSDCPQGYFSNETGSTVCLACPANSDSEPGIATCLCRPGYTGPDGAACQACGPGTYKAISGSDPCSNCAAGTFQGATGRSACQSCANHSSSDPGAHACICNAGYTGPAGGDCLSCAAGRYKPGNGSSPCLECARGSFAASEGQTVCNACPDNSDSTGGDAACICKAGFTGQHERCSACTAGTYKPINGSTPCRDCQTGLYQEATAGTVCSACPANSSSLRASIAMEWCLCDPGYSGPDGGPCEVCELGTSKDVNGSVPCQECARGTYVDRIGSTACLACPLDSFSELGTSGLDGCSCNAGYSGPGGGPCTACAAGQYKMLPGTESCSACLAGSFMNASGASACFRCPSHTFSRSGSATVDHCKCNIGYSGPDGVSCAACGLGTFKAANGSEPCADCPVGTYLNVSGGAECLRCPAESSSTPGRQSLEECSCNAGFALADPADGQYCSACAAGSFKPNNGTGPCLQCRVGTFQNASRMTACLSCPFYGTSARGSTDIVHCVCGVGSTGPAGGPCVACSPGTYKGVNGSGSCMQCAPGTYMEQEAGSACIECPAQSFSIEGSENQARCVCNAGFTGPDGGPCDPCEEGHFKELPGLQSCSPCLQGTYQNDTGSTACRPCAAHTTSTTGGTNPEHCVCEMGYSGPDGGRCSACRAGTFKEQNGSQGCTRCRAGTFANESASSTCTACVANSFSEAGTDAKAGCACNVGYSGRDGGPCLACQLGKYKAINGSAACELCPTATYLSATAGSTCTSCPPLTSSVRGASTDTGCVCIPGHSGPDGGNCSACEIGTFKATNGSETCLQCEAGKYQNMSGQTTCISCPANSHSNPGMWFCVCNVGFTGDANPRCRACDLGSYKDVNGTSTCSACSQGSYSDSEGATVCSSCPAHASSRTGSRSRLDCKCSAGFFGPDGQACSGCERGRYKVVNGSNACLDCNVGTYQNLTNATSCSLCPQLKTSPAGSDDVLKCVCNGGYTGEPGAQCNACGLGTFKEFAGTHACTQCDAGTFLNISGGTGCRTCPLHTVSLAASVSQQSCVCDAGFSGRDGGTCSACVAGRIKPQNGSSPCAKCEAGLFSNVSAGTSCFACPATTFSLPGSDSQAACICKAGYTGPDGLPCSACAVGMFKAVNGSAVCQACPAGRYGNFTGATACLRCPANSDSPVGSTDIAQCTCDPGFSGRDGGRCSSCTPGTFKDVSGAQPCAPCAAGTYSNASALTSCLACPQFSDSAPGSADVRACKCNIGYSGSDGGPCGPCLEGTFKARNGSDSCAACYAGTYLDEQGQSSCLQCPQHTWSRAGSPALIGCVCNPGYFGPAGGACAACAPGRFKDVNGSEECGLCHPGTFSNVSAATSCRQCPSNSDSRAGETVCRCVPGHTGPDGMRCTPCNLGAYKPVNGSSSCISCVTGTYTNATGASVCTECPHDSSSLVGSGAKASCLCNTGYTGNDGGPCQACEVGKFKSVNGSSSCLNCRSGMYQNVSGMATCAHCKAHSHSDVGSDSEQQCLCNFGFSGPDGGACIACVPGRFKGVNGSTPCGQCAAGSYQSEHGATGCNDCLPATASLPGMTYCICIAGYTGPDGLRCSPCAPGTFKRVNGSSDCRQCSRGHYQNESAATYCDVCPADADSIIGSSRKSDCKCNAGYSGPDGTHCNSCGAGSFKAVTGFAPCQSCAPGTFQHAEGSSTCSLCPPHTWSAIGSANRTNCICDPGYDGPDGGVCVACEPGEYKQVNGSSSCTDCSAGRYQNRTAATACILCPEHSVSRVGMPGCVCDAGFLGTNFYACSPCPAGRYKQHNGSGVCLTCASGTFSQPGAALCSDCPGNSSSGSGESVCHCNSGYSGPDGGECNPCGLGAYKDSVGSAACSSCAVGTYNDRQGATRCSECPANTISNVGSKALNRCSCNGGYSGPDGGACSPCEKGTFKAAIGSAECADCPAGTFVSSLGTTVCEACPSHSNSPVGTPATSGCSCNTGFTGQPPSSACSACLAGTFKGLSGSAQCDKCSAGQFSGLSSTLCDSCPVYTESCAGDSTCSVPPGGPKTCRNATISMSFECGAGHTLARGCAANSADFEDHVLQVGDPAAASTSLRSIAASCESFYSWMCEELGTVPGDTLDCPFYCDYVQRAAQRVMLEGCSSDLDCTFCGLTTLKLEPSPGVLCEPSTQYALFSSCVVPSTNIVGFTAAIGNILKLASNKSCPQGGNEGLVVENVGAGPAALTPSQCHEAVDCRYACFTSAFQVTRQIGNITLISQYSGDCNCSGVGDFYGIINYTGGVSITAENAQGQQLVATPFHVANQIMVQIKLDVVCTYTWNVQQGSLLGLPRSTTATSDAQPAALGFLGLVSDGSAQTARRRRTRVDAWSAPGLFDLRATDVSSSIPISCPAAALDCRFDCLGGGFTAELFGASILLTSVYVGSCDCTAVFPNTLPDGTPMLVGLGKEDPSGAFFDFADAVILQEGQFPATGSSSENITLVHMETPSPLNPAAANLSVGSGTSHGQQTSVNTTVVDTSSNQTESPPRLTARLSPYDSTSMILDIGPGLCGYRWRVTGIILGVGVPRPPPPVRPPILQTYTKLVPLEGIPNPSACTIVGDCQFQCLFESGLAGITENGAQVQGDSRNESCFCLLYDGVVTKQTFTNPNWTISADVTKNALRYVYRASSPPCSGYLTVKNGTFLGIPRVEANLTAFNDTALEAAIASAEATASAMTVGVATAVALAVATSVGGAVAGGVAGATAGGAGGAAGGSGAAASSGSVGPLIAQTQFIALTARIGGPDVQPESTQALSGGMGWANLHVVSLHSNSSNATEAEGTEDLPARRRGGRRKANKAARVNSANPGAYVTEGTENSCASMRVSPRELGSTWLAAGCALVVCFFFRMAVNHVVWCVQRRKGAERSPACIPFPCWEVQVFVICFQGLAESAGESIASACLVYEIGGFFTLLILLLFVAFTAGVVFYAIFVKCVSWNHRGMKDTYTDMKEALRSTKGAPILTRVRKVYEAYIIVNNRGGWDGDQDKEEKFADRFSDRWSCLFDSYRGAAWWFGFWGLFKALTFALVLACIFEPSWNSGIVVGLNLVDSVLQLIFVPDGEWIEFIRNFYRALVNVGTSSLVFSYIQDWVDDDRFASVFQMLSVLSLIPALIASLLGPIVTVLDKVVMCCTFITEKAGGGRIGQILAGAGGAAFAVAWADDGAQVAVLSTFEKAEEKSKEVVTKAVDDEDWMEAEGAWYCQPTVNAEATEVASGDEADPGAGVGTEDTSVAALGLKGYNRIGSSRRPQKPESSTRTPATESVKEEDQELREAFAGFETASPWARAAMRDSWKSQKAIAVDTHGPNGAGKVGEEGEGGQQLRKSALQLESFDSRVLDGGEQQQDSGGDQQHGPREVGGGEQHSPLAESAGSGAVAGALAPDGRSEAALKDEVESVVEAPLASAGDLPDDNKPAEPPVMSGEGASSPAGDETPPRPPPIPAIEETGAAAWENAATPSPPQWSENGLPTQSEQPPCSEDVSGIPDAAPGGEPSSAAGADMKQAVGCSQRKGRRPALHIQVSQAKPRTPAKGSAALRSEEVSGSDPEGDYFAISDDSSSDASSAPPRKQSWPLSVRPPSSLSQRSSQQSSQQSGGRAGDTTSTTKTQEKAESTDSESELSYVSANDKDVEMSNKADRSNGLWLTNSRAKDEYAMIVLDFDDDETSSHASSNG